MSFSLSYWKSKNGAYERVYINGDFIDDLKIYFHPDFNPGECPRIFGSKDREAYPEPHASGDIPPQHSVTYSALIQHGIDPDDFTWHELIEATK